MIDIPDTYHPRLHYGAHWSASGHSGYWVRSRADQAWVQACERPDLVWGTAREAATRDDVLTLAEARAAIAAAQRGTP